MGRDGHGQKVCFQLLYAGFYSVSTKRYSTTAITETKRCLIRHSLPNEPWKTERGAQHTRLRLK